MTRSQFWLWWILSNTFGELVGLGLIFIFAPALLIILQSFNPMQIMLPPWSVPSLIAAAFWPLSIVSRGIVLGLAQSWILRTRLPQLEQWAWVLATIVVAALPWSTSIVTQYLGSNLDATTNRSQDMDSGLMALLISLIVAVLGGLVAVPQWQILRQHIRYAAWWIPTNSVAWVCSMLVVFWLTDSLPSQPVLDYRGMLFSLLIAGMGGAIAGTLNGGALLWLLPQRQQ